MNRAQLFLFGVILAQVGACFALSRGTAKQPVPPLPDLQRVDAVTALDLEAAYAQCRPDSAIDLSRLGEMYFAQGFYAEAESCFARASELQPNAGEFCFDRAFTMAHAGRVKEAIVQYEKALELGVSEPTQTQYFLARCYLRTGDVGQAEKILKQLVDLPAAQFELARIQTRKGEGERAYATLSRLANGNSEAAEYWYWAARASRATNRPGEAARRFDRADHAISRGHTPFGEQSQRWYRILESFGLPARRLAIQERLASNEMLGLAERVEDALQTEWYAEGEDALAELAMQQNRADDATRRLDRILAREGPSLDHYWRLGDALAMSNRPEAAEDAWEKGIAIGRGKYADLAGLHKTLADWHTNKTKKAAEAARHTALATLNEGLDQFARGKYGDANATLQRTLKLDPQLSQAWFYLGEARRLTRGANPPAPGQSAEDAYQQCLRIKPNHGRALAALELLKNADQR